MSNNSSVCTDGSEIGRAQYLQAIASKITPSSAMNPVLLKPGSDRRSFIVVRGKPAGVLESGEYAHGRSQLSEPAWQAYEELADSHQLVVCEGAGSPAEINLRQGDYVNMGLARHFNLPVVLVGDIDRGGVLASIYGTWGLLGEEDRQLLSGYIINKFRGDLSILTPGLDEITRRTTMPYLGTLPFLKGVWLDGEDTLEVGRWRHDIKEGNPVLANTVDGVEQLLNIAVVRFPRISNATDVDALACEPGVNVQVTTDPAVCRNADLLVLPGSRSTLTDLAWMRDQGIAEVVNWRAKNNLPVLGICGGYQMLGHQIQDGIESDQSGNGLGMLPINVVFHKEKILARTTSSWESLPVEGYEIHHGICEPFGQATPFLDGVCQGNVWGTMMHGAYESDDFRRHFLAMVADKRGLDWQPDYSAPGMNAQREQMINSLAEACEQYLDLDQLIALAR